ncbi:MAG: WG repeat-containing protein [Muribaculaceae bacterium]|nr:WG repeat-containing protein [Muribaculaceae bacterium]
MNRSLSLTSRIAGAVRIALLALFVIATATPEISAATSETPASQARKTTAKKNSAKKNTTEAKTEASAEAPASQPEKPARTPVVRGSEILQLKARKDSETKLYGYENVGKKYNWWAEAHALGAGKEQLNQGFETQWVITPQYTRVAKEFSEGLAAVELDGKVGFIDRLNRFIIPPTFEPMDHPDGFRYGLAAVKKDGKFGYIDKRGTWVFPPVFDDAENFGDDFLAVVKIGKKFGCIDLLGDTVVPFDYPAKEIMKTVPLKNKPYREAKKHAKEMWDQGAYADVLEIIAAPEVDARIKDPNYTEFAGNKTPEGAKSCGDGLFITTGLTGLMGASDTYGRTILPAIYKSVRYDPVQRLFVVDSSANTGESEDARVGIATTAGGWVIPPMFESIGDFDAAGFAPVSVGAYKGTVDVCGLADTQFLQALLQASIDEQGTRYTRRLIGILPTCAPAHNCLGIYYASEHDNLKDAIHHFTVAHNLDPENEDFKANMKAAKGERNSRRWNRVLTGMTIAAAVLTAGAVTYSAIQGAPMQASGFSSSTMAFDPAMSTSEYSSDSDGSGASSSGSRAKKTEPAGLTAAQAQAVNTLRRTYDNYETQVVHYNTYPEQHQPGDKKEYQRKMREIRLKLKNKYGVERVQSPHETN